MKKVAKYVDILEQTGVKNYKKMLTKEELELYEDYQHFKKKGYIKDWLRENFLFSNFFIFCLAFFILKNIKFYKKKVINFIYLFFYVINW